MVRFMKMRPRRASFEVSTYLRLADRRDHPLGRGGVEHRIVAAAFEVFLQREFRLLVAVVAFCIKVENLIFGHGFPVWHHKLRWLSLSAYVRLKRSSIIWGSKPARGRAVKRESERIRPFIAMERRRDKISIPLLKMFARTQSNIFVYAAPSALVATDRLGPMSPSYDPGAGKQQRSAARLVRRSKFEEIPLKSLRIFHLFSTGPGGPPADRPPEPPGGRISRCAPGLPGEAVLACVSIPARMIPPLGIQARGVPSCRV